MQTTDPFDILREHDPAGPAHPAPDQDLLAAITAVPTGMRRRTLRRRVLVLAAVILGLASIAAAWYLTQRPVLSLTVICHSEPTPVSDIFGTSAQAGSPSVEDCRVGWESQFLTSDDVEPGSVPPLTGCVNDEGSLVVFPTDDPTICDRFGLAERGPDRPDDRLATVDEAQDAMVAFMLSASCHDIDDTVAEMTAILARFGLDDWSVDRQPDVPGRICGSLSFDVPNRSVMVVPIPPPP